MGYIVGVWLKARFTLVWHYPIKTTNPSRWDRMSLDVSLKHSEYMFRHEILKVIIIEGGSPILTHLVDGIIQCRGIQKYV